MGVEVTGVQRLQKDLLAMASRAKNPKDLMTEAGEIMVRSVLPQVFRDSGAPGPRWKDPVLRPGGKPLLDTGRLSKSITYTATDRELVVGVPSGLGALSKSARVHQYGATITAKNVPYLIFPIRGATGMKPVGWVKKKQVTIPQRRFLFWSTEALEKIKRRWVVLLSREAT
jgi:phage gpG-like protein